LQSPCNPLIEDYTKIYYVIDKGDISFIQYKMSLGGPKSMRKVDGPILILIDFSVPAFTPRLSSTETSLQLSEVMAGPLYYLSYMYRCHQQRDLDKFQAFRAYHLYDCTMWVTGQNLVTPLSVYPLA
jgi:hypothetical protein